VVTSVTSFIIEKQKLQIVRTHSNQAREDTILYLSLRHF
jgi:hypothetical protein